MTCARRSRACLLALSAAFLVALGGSASAQVDLPSAPDTGLTLPDTGTVTDTIDDTIDDTTQPITDITDPVTGGTDTETTTDLVTDTIDATLGGSDPVSDTTDQLDAVLRDVVGGTGVEEVDGALQTITDPDGEATSGSSGGSGKRRRAIVFDKTYGEPPLPAALGAVLERDAVATPTARLHTALPLNELESGPSLVSEIVQAVVEGAKRFAFPLSLLVIAGGFLVVQSRFDRKDPKLAIAPVEADHDLLRFE